MATLAVGVLGLLGSVGIASAQSPLTTLFAATTQGTAGGNVYFDLTVRNPTTVTSLDINTNAAIGTTGTIEVYRTANGGTYVGNTASTAAWTLVGTGTITSAGNNQHTQCDVSDFNLDIGRYGIAVHYVGIIPLYTNNGTNPTYSTEELLLATGAAQPVSFSGGINSPRIWNGSIYYQPYVVAASGACCHGNGTCDVVDNASCAGVFQGAGTTCAGVTCTHRGACCNSTSGVCSVSFTGASGCPSGTTYQGDTSQSTACGSNPCGRGACCNTAGGCTFSTSTGCASVWGAGVTGSAFQGAGTTCNPTNPCPQPPAPTNDECANAIVLNPSAQSVTVLGNNALATPDADLTPAVDCATTGSGRDVFYSYTPTLTGNYTLTTCNAVTISHDTVLSIHSGCPADGSNSIACSDDDCTGGAAGPSTLPNAAYPTITLTAGTTYIIRVATWHPTNPTVSGPFALTVTSEQPGVCCAQAGTCTISVASQCTAPSIFSAGQTTCSASFCSGSCCNNATAACFVGGPGQCGVGNTFGGVNTTCTTAPCAGQACCNPSNGVCTVTGSDPCPSGAVGQGPGSTCAVNPCGEACCSANGSCVFTGLGLCPSGTTAGGIGSTCIPNNCAAPVSTNDDCTAATQLTVDAPAIAGSTYGSSQDTIPSCTGTQMDVWYRFTSGAAGQYTVTAANTNTLANFNVAVAVYSDCPAFTEVACLGANQSTSALTFTAAAATTYYVRVANFIGEQGPHTVRVQYVAPGVCCRGATCTTTITTAADCTAGITPGSTAGATFPSAASCNTGTVSNTPCCYANYNKVNGVTVTDIFDFLSDWFGGRPYANTGGNGSPAALAVQNIFDFLSNWFAGGCQ